METRYATTEATVATGNSHFKKISWAAVFAGALIALGIQLLLSLLGLGVGMSAVDPAQEQNPAAGLGTGAAIWSIVTLLLALFAGSWVAGRLSRTAHRFEGLLHGLLTFVVLILFNIYLLTSAAGSLLNTAGGILGNTVSLAGQGAVAASGNSQVQQKAAQAANDLQSRVSDLQAQVQSPEAEAKARQVGEDVARAASKAGFYSFIGLLLGAIISAVGAHLGRRTDSDLVPATGRLQTR